MKIIKFIPKFFYKFIKYIFIFFLIISILIISKLVIVDIASEKSSKKMKNLIENNPQEVERMKKIIESKENALKYIIKNNENTAGVTENGEIMIAKSSFNDNFPNFGKNGFYFYHSSIGSDTIFLRIERKFNIIPCREHLIFYKNDPNYKDNQCLDEDCEYKILRKVTNNWYWQRYCRN